MSEQEIRDAKELKPFLNERYQVVSMPSKFKKKLYVWYYLAGLVKSGRDYTEPEINDLLDDWAIFHDHATLRRELYNRGLLERTKDCKRYWKPEEFLQTMEKYYHQVAGRELKNLFRLNMSAGYCGLKQYADAKMILEELAGAMLHGNQEMVRRLNLCNCYFHLGETEKALQLNEKSKKIFDRFRKKENVSMKCPYCGKEMETGTIQSAHEITWLPGEKRRFFGNAEFHEGAVVLSELSFLKGSAVVAHLCRECGKVIIDIADEKSDLNKR